MAWWMWVTVGIVLLGSELTLVSAEFYLVFVGVAAVLTGLVQAVWTGGPEWAYWALFAAAALVGVKLFRERLSARFRVAGLPPPGLSPVGEFVVLPTRLDAGAETRIEFRGASWAVRNAGLHPIAGGLRVRVAAVDGLTLLVETPVEGN